MRVTVQVTECRSAAANLFDVSLHVRTIMQRKEVCILQHTHLCPQFTMFVYNNDLVIRRNPLLIMLLLRSKIMLFGLMHNVIRYILRIQRKSSIVVFRIMDYS